MLSRQEGLQQPQQGEEKILLPCVCGGGVIRIVRLPLWAGEKNSRAQTNSSH